jgi:hypothetical protein
MPVTRSFEPVVLFDASEMLISQAGAAVGVMLSMNVTTWL